MYEIRYISLLVYLYHSYKNFIFDLKAPTNQKAWTIKLLAELKANKNLWNKQLVTWSLRSLNACQLDYPATYLWNKPINY